VVNAINLVVTLIRDQILIKVDKYDSCFRLSYSYSFLDVFESTDHQYSTWALFNFNKSEMTVPRKLAFQAYCSS